MEYEKLVILRGYDLFFEDTSENTLISICRELGNSSSYDVELQKVTHMLTNDVFMELGKLNECHDVANAAGEYFEMKYECEFVASELYLRMTKEETELFKNNPLSIAMSY